MPRSGSADSIPMGGCDSATRRFVAGPKIAIYFTFPRRGFALTTSFLASGISASACDRADDG